MQLYWLVGVFKTSPFFWLYLIRKIGLKSLSSSWFSVSSPWAVHSPAVSSFSMAGPRIAGSASCWRVAWVGFCLAKVGACGLMWAGSTPSTALSVTVGSASSSSLLGMPCYLRYAVPLSWLSLWALWQPLLWWISTSCWEQRTWSFGHQWL